MQTCSACDCARYGLPCLCASGACHRACTDDSSRSAVQAYLYISSAARARNAGVKTRSTASKIKVPDLDPVSVLDICDIQSALGTCFCLYAGLFGHCHGFHGGVWGLIFKRAHTRRCRRYDRDRTVRIKVKPVKADASLVYAVAVAKFRI